MTKNILTIAFLALTLGMTSSNAYAAKSVEIIEKEHATQILINPSTNVLRIIGGKDKIVEIYNVAGVCIYSTKIDSAEKTIDVNLNRGCYIVKVGKTVRKISIR